MVGERAARPVPGIAVPDEQPGFTCYQPRRAVAITVRPLP